MGSLGGAIRGLQVGPASTKDEARLLSGHESTWRLSHPRIRLSRLSFPAQEGDLAGMSIRRFLPARCQPDRAEGDQADDPAVGTPSPERPSWTIWPDCTIRTYGAGSTTTATSTSRHF